MKHHVRTLACGIALLVAAAILGACGGKQTMASKSAAAYDEARRKGVNGGHDAGLATTSAQESMPGMDHTAMPGMDHSQMSGMSHGNKDHAHDGMAGMDHSQMPGMQHGSTTGSAQSMAAMDHSQMPGMQHGTTGTQTHDMSAMQHGSMAGMQHGTAAPLVIAPPASNSAIAQTRPASTLRQDEFDAPAPSAIDEAAKAAGGMKHSPNTPKPPSHEHHHGGSGGTR